MNRLVDRVTEIVDRPSSTARDQVCHVTRCVSAHDQVCHVTRFIGAHDQVCHVTHVSRDKVCQWVTEIADRPTSTARDQVSVGLS